MTYETIAVEPLTSTLGARIAGLDLVGADDVQCHEIRDALSEYGVLVFPDQIMTAQEQCKFTARFGPSHGHPVREYILGRPDDPLSLVENYADKPPQDEQSFHTDYSFNTVVPDLAVLRAEIVPPTGGDTIWSSSVAAYEALSETIKAILQGLVAVHEAGERFWFEYARTLGDEVVGPARKAFPGAQHPVVETHPLTGRELLFVNAGYTVRIVGLSPRENRAVLGLLFDQLRDPAFHYRHKWRLGDVVMWDEHSTQHMGPHDFYPHARRLTRVTAGHREPQHAGIVASI
jgi:taurine dioxygenase